MDLGLVERGTKLHIRLEPDGQGEGAAYEAVFRYLDLDNEALFIVQSAGLFKDFDKLDSESRLFISYITGSKISSFYGKAKEKRGGSSLVVIEQLTEVETYSRRLNERAELRLGVLVYGLPEEFLAGREHVRPDGKPDLAERMYDLSLGGFCVITDIMLSSPHDPNYLAEFALSEKDRFLVPARLVRRSNYPRTKIGRFDYGFKFVFDNMPDEVGRLTTAILATKLSLMKF